MKEKMSIVRLVSTNPAIGTASDFYATIDGIKIPHIESVKIHNIEPNKPLKATITVYVALGCNNEFPEENNSCISR